MARIRTIKPEFWQDEKLAPMDPLTRLVFLGLISMADDAGRLLDNVKIIDAFIFPNTSDTAHEALMRLSGAGRIVRGHTASGQAVIQIAGWARHQRVQHPQLAAALPELVAASPDRAIHERLMNDSCGAHEPLAPHSNDLRSTSNDQRSTTDDDDPRAQARAATAASASTVDLPTGVRTALAPYLAAARYPASIEGEIRAALDGMYGTSWPEATVIVALRNMQANNVSPFNARAFRAFLSGVEQDAARERERRADESARQSRAEGERHKREAPPRVLTGLPPDQVPDMRALLAREAPALVPNADRGAA